MATKVRKPRAASPRTYSQMPSTPAAPATTGSSTSNAASASMSAKGSQVGAGPKTVDLAVEYAVVGWDLRRLLITAGVMFAVLIAVNLVITFIM